MLCCVKVLKMLTLPSASCTCSHQVLVPRSNNVSVAPSYFMYAMGDGWPSRYAEVIITESQTMPRILVVNPFNIAYLWDLPCKRGYCKSCLRVERTIIRLDLYFLLVNLVLYYLDGWLERTSNFINHFPPFLIGFILTKPWAWYFNHQASLLTSQSGRSCSWSWPFHHNLCSRRS